MTEGASSRTEQPPVTPPPETDQTDLNTGVEQAVMPPETEATPAAEPVTGPGNPPAESPSIPGNIYDQGGVKASAVPAAAVQPITLSTVKPSDWAAYAPNDVKLDDTGQMTSKSRGDIVVKAMQDNGAPPEVISDFIDKNRDAIDAFSGAQTVVQGVSASSEPMFVVVNASDYDAAMNTDDQQAKLDKLIDLGVYPKGTVMMAGGDKGVQMFNEQYGTSLTSPYLTPGQQDALNQFVQQSDALQLLMQNGYGSVDERGNITLTPDGVLAADQNPAVMSALVTLGFQASDLRDSAQQLRDFQTAQADQAAWERDVLPSLPQDLQDAYREGKDSGNFSKYNALVARYQSDQQSAMGQFYPSLYLAQESAEVKQVLADLKALGYIGAPTLADQYPSGGAPFEMYLTPAAKTTYDLDAALRGGYSADKLMLAFGTTAVKSAQSRVAFIDYLDKFYKSPDGKGYLLPDFVRVSMDRGEYDKAVADLRNAGFRESDIQQATSLASQRVASVTPGNTSWASDKAFQLEQSLNEFIEGGKQQAGLVGQVMGGIGATGAALLMGIPILGLKVIGTPTLAGKGSVIWNAAKSIPLVPYNWVKNLVTGKYYAQIKTGNLFDYTFDTLNTIIVLEMGKGVMAKVTTYISPQGIPSGAIIKELSTGRVKTPEEFSGVYADAMNTVERVAATRGGRWVDEVPIEGTRTSLRFVKNP
ncbi:MAG: hypothetical protein JRN35_05885, partial [Nitrososphaerota archaeon]|nr:hypothetical protein [Nitrososphaerota archaeon]